MANKHNPTDRSEPTKVSGVIVNKAVENLKVGSPKKTQSEANEADRQQRIATAAYYRAEQRDFNSGNEMQDWLEAESEIDSVS
jgi:hypothetical protein